MMYGSIQREGRWRGIPLRNERAIVLGTAIGYSQALQEVGGGGRAIQG